MIRLPARPTPPPAIAGRGSGASRAAGPGGAPDPDAEFVAGSWDEAAPPSLDFDDEIASRNLHEREPEGDFATIDERAPDRRADAADLVDLVDIDDDTPVDDPADDLRDGPELRAWDDAG